MLIFAQAKSLEGEVLTVITPGGSVPLTVLRVYERDRRSSTRFFISHCGGRQGCCCPNHATGSSIRPSGRWILVWARRSMISRQTLVFMGSASVDTLPVPPQPRRGGFPVTMW